MVWILWDRFTGEWLKRARRKKGLDDGDRFISLWIAFNGWMRGKFGESLSDKRQLEKVKQHKELEEVFNLLKCSPSFSGRLVQLGKYQVPNMRHPLDSDMTRQYDGNFGSLVEVFYNVRNNLFHGRKNIQEDKKDFELVSLSYRILLKLFTEYLRRYEPYSLSIEGALKVSSLGSTPMRSRQKSTPVK